MRPGPRDQEKLHPGLVCRSAGRGIRRSELTAESPPHNAVDMCVMIGLDAMHTQVGNHSLLRLGGP